MSLILTLAIVILILGLAGVFAVSVSRQQKQRDRYLSVITRDEIRNTREDAEAKQAAKQRADISKKLKQAGADEKAKKKDRASIRELMIQAGFEAPVSRYWIGAFCAAIGVFLVLSVVTGWPAIARAMLAVAGFFALPKMFLKIKAGKRQKKFLEEFPDALDASVRLLQAGMPISEAVAMVSREYQGPLREEMLRLYDNQKIGMPLGTAALEMAKRVPLTEVHMFATALQIQSETGSSLSEVLSNLSAVIRARFRLKRKVKALSSEAKASAAIIAALPILVSLGLYAVNPNYISILFDTTKGNFWLGAAIFWMSCGVLIMRQMINFKV